MFHSVRYSYDNSYLPYFRIWSQIHAGGSKSECNSDICNFILYIYCMLVREIWKLIHPRVSYSPRAMPEVNMILVGKYIFIFPVPACNTYLIYRMKPRTHIYVKYCWQAYFKSIGTLSRIFKNHMQIMRSDCLGRFPVKKTIALAGKPARLPRGWNTIFISRNMIFVLCSDFYPLSNQINLFMVINIWGIIQSYILGYIIY